MNVRVAVGYEAATGKFRLVVDEKFCGVFDAETVVEVAARYVEDYVIDARQLEI